MQDESCVFADTCHVCVVIISCMSPGSCFMLIIFKFSISVVCKFRGNFYSRVFNFSIFFTIAKNAKLNTLVMKYQQGIWWM